MHLGMVLLMSTTQLVFIDKQEKVLFEKKVPCVEHETDNFLICSTKVPCGGSSNE